MQSSSGKDREFVFTAEDFEWVRRLIYDHAGISLNPTKQDMVYSRLASRLCATKISNFRDYLALLENNNEIEWEAFVNSLTTNLTSFFREPHHFPLLAEHVLKHRHRQGNIDLRCSASSTGEEPYSMAMVDAFGSFTPPVKILARSGYQCAGQGRGGRLSAGARGETLCRYREALFPEGNRRAGRFGAGAPGTAHDDHVPAVKFAESDEWPVRGPLDAIFCRNVMIYFDRETQLKILERFAPLLRPDGLLFAGHSESFHNAGHVFSLRGKTVYELAQPHARP